MNKNFEIVFDSAGGLIMGLLHGENRVYVHAYDDMEQAARDLNDFFTLDYSVALWDGNLLDDEEFDPDCLEFNAAGERSGELFWAMEIQHIRESIQIHSWQNVQEFMKVWESYTGE